MSHTEEELEELGDEYDLGNEDEEALLADDEGNQATWEESCEEKGLINEDIVYPGGGGGIEDEDEDAEELVSDVQDDKQNWDTQQDEEILDLHDPRLESDDDEDEQEDSEGRARFRSERSSVPSVARAQRLIPDTLESVEVPQEEGVQQHQQRRHPKWGARGMRGGPRGRGSPRGLMQQRVHPQMRVPPFHQPHPHPAHMGQHPPHMRPQYQGMMGQRPPALMDQQYSAQIPHQQPPPIGHHPPLMSHHHPMHIAAPQHHAPQQQQQQPTPQAEYTPVLPPETVRTPYLPPQQPQKILVNPHFKGPITDRPDLWLSQQRAINPEYTSRSQQPSQEFPVVSNYYGTDSTRPAQIPPQTTSASQNYYSQPSEYYSQNLSSEHASPYKSSEVWTPVVPPFQGGYPPQVQHPVPSQHYAPPQPFHRPPPPHVINQPIHQPSPPRWNEPMGAGVESSYHPNYTAPPRPPAPFIQELPPHHSPQGYGPQSGYMMEPRMGPPAPGPRFPHPQSQTQIFQAPDYSMPPPSFQEGGPPFDLGPRHRIPPQHVGPMIRAPRGPHPLRHPSHQYSENSEYQNASFSIPPQLGDQGYEMSRQRVVGVALKASQSVSPQVTKRHPAGVGAKLAPNQHGGAIRGKGRGVRQTAVAKPLVGNQLAMKRRMGPAITSPVKQVKLKVATKVAAQNVQQTQLETQVPAVIEDEDEETKAYRLGIEAQKRAREEFLRKKELQRKITICEKQKQLQLAQANKALIATVPSECGNEEIQQQVGCAISTIVTRSPPKPGQSAFLNKLYKQPTPKRPPNGRGAPLQKQVLQAINYGINKTLIRQPGVNVASSSGAQGIVTVQRALVNVGVGRGQYVAPSPNTTRIVLPPRNPGGPALRMGAPNTLQKKIQKVTTTGTPISKNPAVIYKPPGAAVTGQKTILVGNAAKVGGVSKKYAPLIHTKLSEIRKETAAASQARLIPMRVTPTAVATPLIPGLTPPATPQLRGCTPQTRNGGPRLAITAIRKILGAPQPRGVRPIAPQQQIVRMVVPPEHLQTSCICVENLANTVTKDQLLTMCEGLSVLEVYLEMGARQARITFSTVEEARNFLEKYNHRMIDLSLIRVRFV